MLSLLLLTLAQDPAALTATYAHVPVSALKAVTGGALSKVGLYSATVCNNTTGLQTLAEGFLITHAHRFGVIDPALNLLVISQSQKKTKKYKILKGLEYAGMAANFGVGPQGGKTFRYVATAFAGVTGQLSATYDANRQIPPEVIQALVQVTRVISLQPGACESRLMFGEYIRSFQPYEVRIR